MFSLIILISSKPIGMAGVQVIYAMLLKSKYINFIYVIVINYMTLQDVKSCR